MAKVIKTETKSQTIGASYSFLLMLLIGLLTGALFWCLTLAIEHYVIDPVYCRSNINPSVCMNGESVSGNIASILAGLFAVMAMVRFSLARPLLVALASVFALWGLTDLLQGLNWGEAIAWSILLYALAYVLFSWAARYTKIIPVLIAMTIIVVGVRAVVGL